MDKAEFVVMAGCHRELHQVRRSHPNGKWSMVAFRAEGLLKFVGEELAGNDDRFVFASGSEARDLSDLCDAARDAESVEEFKRSFLGANKRERQFKTLLAEWECDVPTAMERLRRIHARTIDEHQLREKAGWQARALFSADPASVLPELRAVALDSVHRTITRKELAEDLSQRGYPLRILRSPDYAGVAAEAATERYLDGARKRLIHQTLVSRAASTELLSRLDGPASDSVLTGAAGAGKTACVVEVVDTLRQLGTPVLAFRLDRVPPSVSTTAALADVLDLEESPVLVLAAAAQTAGRLGILFVDQLDVVSTMSGRTSGAFDLVEQLLHEARGMRPRTTIHTVVVCREFDWRNDSRLRRLMPEQHHQIGVTHFTDEDVERLLIAARFNPALFHTRQLALLRLPQNLSLFLEAGFDTSLTPAFDTATELFDRYWTEKRRSVEERVAPSPDEWNSVIETLCDEMTATQQLSVSRERLDTNQPTYLHSLASEGVLSFDGRRYGFGHESFFDYCFARVFSKRSEDLLSLLTGSEQHLFRRAQVRQVLAYLRIAHPSRYLVEIRALLSNDAVRTHIKDLSFALLADVHNPIDQEWRIWEEWTAPVLKAIESGAPRRRSLSELAWRRLFESPSWFPIADERGKITQWLSSENESLTDIAVSYLRVHHAHSPDRVASLLAPYADCGEKWRERLRSLMETTEHHTSRAYLDLLLRLIDNGTLDDVSRSIAVNDTFWLMVYGLSENRPEWFPEVVAQRVRRRVAVIRASGENPDRIDLIGYDEAASKTIEESAKCAPNAFVEHVLPVVLEISDSFLIDDEPPKRDAVWGIPHKTDHPRGDDACLFALAAALAVIARDGTNDLLDLIAALRGRDTYTANYLLLALYRGGGQKYADDAVSLLCDQPWRLQCGYSESRCWWAREVLRVAIPYASVQNRDRLEAVLLSYLSPFERSKAGQRYSEGGRTRFDLLSAIPNECRSDPANKHLAELARRFGRPTAEPQGAIAGMVESPITEPAIGLMTDAQWLSAIVKYDAEYPSFSMTEPLKGGARELAQALESRAKEDPDRFARLSLLFPKDANPVYIEHILAALSDSTVSDDLKIAVCRKAFVDSFGQCGRRITDVLARVEDPLPDDAVEILHRLATEHDDPPKEMWRESAGEGTVYDNGDIHMSGINSTRGRAAEAIQTLILTDGAYVERFQSTIDQMIFDRSASVISCVAGTVGAVAYRNAALGMRLFKSMDLSEDRLLETHHIYHFIRASVRKCFAEMQPIVERMLRSGEPRVCEAGARLASIAALDHQEAAILVAEALDSGVRHRVGVAQVASANVAKPECRTWCEAMLIELFNDEDADVRKETATCFSRLPDEALEHYGGLIGSFCESKAFSAGAFWLLHALEKSPGRLPGITCMVCERSLETPSRDAFKVAKLVFRTYQQHQNDEWTSRSLDLIDRLCLESIPGTGNEFEQFDR